MEDKDIHEDAIREEELKTAEKLGYDALSNYLSDKINIAQIVPNNTSNTDDKRRSGRTTRLVDAYIQSLFISPPNTLHIIRDHHNNSDLSSITHKDLFRRILNRLEAEHYIKPNSPEGYKDRLILLADFQKLILYFKILPIDKELRREEIRRLLHAGQTIY